MLHENQHLADAPGYSAPRSLGFSGPVTQSADVAGSVAEVQVPRLSSAWANNSASFGSFPDVSRISRLSMQPIAARRAGKVSPWHDQPDISMTGWSRRLTKPRQDGASLALP